MSEDTERGISISARPGCRSTPLSRLSVRLHDHGENVSGLLDRPRTLSS